MSANSQLWIVIIGIIGILLALFLFFSLLRFQLEKAPLDESIEEINKDKEKKKTKKRRLIIWLGASLAVAVILFFSLLFFIR
ncbi:MAG: hypothetical protein PHO91_03340 [Patescibacteria group bacterium]|nr:hypothetical protein [Patescibacteria group bacterium]